MRPALRDLLIIGGITVGWALILGYGLLYLVFGDCFEPGCRSGRDAEAQTFLVLAGAGYLLSLLVYFRSRHRRVKGARNSTLINKN